MKSITGTATAKQSAAEIRKVRHKRTKALTSEGLMLNRVNSAIMQNYTVTPTGFEPVLQA
jgi:hypothetical protein